MTRTDKISMGLCAMSGVMGTLRPLVPMGWPQGLLYTLWLAPLFLWFGPLLWKRFTPPCTLRQWWAMHKLGYRYDGLSQFELFETYSARSVYVTWSADTQDWRWYCWTEIGTDAQEETGGPTSDPVAAHVLGCVENWGRN